MGPKHKKRKGTTGPPLRRSARLAGLEPVDYTSGPQRSSFATRAIVVPTTLGMELAVPPPTRMVVGKALKVPLLVTVVVSYEDDLDEEAMGEISGIWAYVSLMSEDKKTCLAPPREDLLQGRRVDSMHPIDNVRDGKKQTIGYVAFHDLMISEAGRYCFKINVIDMNDEMVGDPEGGGKVLPALHTGVFDVVNAADSEEQNSEAEKALSELLRKGIIPDLLDP